MGRGGGERREKGGEGGERGGERGERERKFICINHFFGSIQLDYGETF